MRVSHYYLWPFYFTTLFHLSPAVNLIKIMSDQCSVVNSMNFFFILYSLEMFEYSNPKWKEQKKTVPWNLKFFIYWLFICFLEFELLTNVAKMINVLRINFKPFSELKLMLLDMTTDVRYCTSIKTQQRKLFQSPY